MMARLNLSHTAADDLIWPAFDMLLMLNLMAKPVKQGKKTSKGSKNISNR
jgi:hypothetical protein